MLINLKNQLLGRSIQLSIDDRRLHGFPGRIGYYAARRPSAHANPSAHADPPSPTRQAYLTDEFEVEDIEMTDIDYQPAAHLTLYTLPPAAPPATRTVEAEPPRRTPTETLVVEFMVTLLGGLASLVQELSPRPLCIANSFETTYTFGPLRNTSQGQANVGFRARIDGSIPRSLALTGMLPEAAIFEAKHATRQDTTPSLPVLAQQSMKHVAYIWERHKNENDQTWSKRRKPYHTFMISQNHLHFYISIGTNDGSYLNYIFGPGKQPVLPAQGEVPFLKIQESGPFIVTNEERLAQFLQIMLSFIIWQLRQADMEAIFHQALR